MHLAIKDGSTGTVQDIASAILRTCPVVVEVWKLLKYFFIWNTVNGEPDRSYTSGPALFAMIRVIYSTPGRRQSKTLSTFDGRGSELDRNSVFDCNLSPISQMAIENYISNDFRSTLLDSIGVFDCCLPGVYRDSYFICPDKQNLERTNTIIYFPTSLNACFGC